MPTKISRPTAKEYLRSGHSPNATGVPKGKKRSANKAKTRDAMAAPAVSNKFAGLATKTLKNTSKSAVVPALVGHALNDGIDGRHYFDPTGPQGAVALNPADILRVMGKNGQAKKHVAKIAAQIEAHTGHEIDPALVAAAAANPEHIMELFVLTPKMIRQGFTVQNARVKSDGKASTEHYILPKHFDLGAIESVAYCAPNAEPKLIEKGLWRGSLPTNLPVEQKRINTVMAEVFDRLASNTQKPDAARFSVTFEGGTYTRVDTFLKALTGAGYEVEVKTSHRVANFLELLTKDEKGQWQDIAGAFLIPTGIKDADGNEAALAAGHSEMLIAISPTKDAKNQDLKADLRFFQGIDRTGFYPAKIFREPTWCGGVISDTYTGDKAIEAVELAGLFADVVQHAADAQNLADSGYGLTGGCNDSVAVLHSALGGRAAAYPLVMNDKLLLGELEKRLSDKNRHDDPGYRAIRKAIKDTPNDLELNSTTAERALASLPWPAGKEPFVGAAKAREILESALKP